MTSKKSRPHRHERRATQAARRRAAARLAAVQALYEMDLADAPPDPVLRNFIQDRWQAGVEEEGREYVEPDEELFTRLVRGATERRDELDGIINPALRDGLDVAGLQAVMRALLRLATFELLAVTDVPARVVITEYIEVAKAFFTGPEPDLVNAALDRMVKVLRAEEMEGVNGEKPGDPG